MTARFRRKAYATRKSKSLYVHVKSHIRKLYPIYVRSHIRFQGKNKEPVLVRGHIRYLKIIHVKSYCRRINLSEKEKEKNSPKKSPMKKSPKKVIEKQSPKKTVEKSKSKSCCTSPRKQRMK